MGNAKAAGVLQTTLDEEKQTDQGRTEIAEGGINWEAEQEPAAEDSEN